jgi:ATP-dependent DNA helicase PIF1
MQVVFTGDFFQLPPVGNHGDEETSMFCFESSRWIDAFKMENHVVLKHIFRQEDSEYKEILNQIRWGELDELGTNVLMKCVKREVVGDIIPTKLFAIRSKTDFVNSRMYEKIEGDEYIYAVQSKTDLKTYVDSGKPIETEHIVACTGFSKKECEVEITRLLEGSNRSQELRLKKGARVMCLHNICVDQGICNGSQGVVVDFVASADSTVKVQKVPLVLFSNGKRLAIEPVWVQSPEFPCIGIGQIPLCLAWALTIHKIQGATLAMAEMDLGDSVFEFGQTYVALSRIQNLNGLYLSAFQPRKIKANPVVKAFYRNIPEMSYEIVENSENIFRDFELKEEEYVSEEKDPTIKVIRL